MVAPPVAVQPHHATGYSLGDGTNIPRPGAIPATILGCFLNASLTVSVIGAQCRPLASTAIGYQGHGPQLANSIGGSWTGTCLPVGVR